MCRGGDPRIAQLKAVVDTSALSLRGEACAVEGSVKEVTGTVSGKHTSCTISAVCSRRQAENEQACRWIAERRYWLPPVFLVNVRASLRDGNLFAIPNQTRTPLAFNNLLGVHDKVLFVTFGNLEHGLH